MLKKRKNASEFIVIGGNRALFYVPLVVSDRISSIDMPRFSAMLSIDIPAFWKSKTDLLSCSSFCCTSIACLGTATGTSQRELKDKDSLIAKKDAEIKELNVKVTKLTEEVDGLKFRLTLIDEDAVQKLRNARIAEKTCTDKAERELGNLRSAYQLTNWDGTQKQGLGKLSFIVVHILLSE